MPATTIFIPIIMALSVPYRTIDSGDIKYSPRELRYRGASNGPVQVVGRARECGEQTGQLLILQFLLGGYTLLIASYPGSSPAATLLILPFYNTHIHRVAEVFLPRARMREGVKQSVFSVCPSGEKF